MTQTISVSCKLEVPPEFSARIDPTFQAFADGCNHVLNVSREHDQRNTTKLHHLVYHDIRALYGLKANHACQAIRRVVYALKTRNKVRKFNPSSLSLDSRTFRFIEDAEQVSVTLLDGAVKIPLCIGNYQRALLKGQKPTSAVLVKRQNGDYYIQIAVTLETPPTGKTPKVIGVDLGQRDIAHTSTGQSWNGGDAKAVRERYFNTRRSIQRKRTRSSRRLLRRLKGKEARFRKNINHAISKQLVSEAKEASAAIALEDLTGIRQRAKVRKSQRREHHGWSFYQLREFITYKARIAGIPVVLVNPAYTSKTCSRCHHVGQRSGKDFKCGHCGLHIDADLNGAINISVLGLSVTQPEILGMACQLEGQLSLLVA